MNKYLWAVAFVLSSSGLLAERTVTEAGVFTSPLGFSLRYPSDCHGGNQGYKTFACDIGPSPPRTQGPIPPKRGQAHIYTYQLGSATDISVQISGRLSTEKNANISRRRAEASIPNECTNITELRYLDAFAFGAASSRAPTVYTQEVDYFCQIVGRAFDTHLSYSQGDARGAYYEDVGLQIAESLTVSKR